LASLSGISNEEDEVEESFVEDKEPEKPVGGNETRYELLLLVLSLELFLHFFS
jgi:hypothetical protein